MCTKFQALQPLHKTLLLLLVVGIRTPLNYYVTDI